MIRRQRGPLVWYEFELLQPYPFLRHGCFTSVSSLNTGFSPKEDPRSIQRNRDLIATTLFENSSGTIIDGHQVHGADVAIVTSSSPLSTPADAMATSLPNIALLIQHADCQAGLLFDPEHRIIAAVHSGWRGSVQNIYKATVDRLKAVWGSCEETLIACISPSLGPCHAEFRNWEDELPSAFIPFRRPGNYFDFWEISRSQLLSCGLAPLNIEIASVCTYCHPELFFSYRRTKAHERNATCIAIKGE